MAIVKVLAATVFRSAGVHDADALLSLVSDEQAVTDATSNNAEKLSAIFLIFLDMNLPFHL